MYAAPKPLFYLTTKTTIKMNFPISIPALTSTTLGTSLLGLGIFRLLTPKPAYTLFGLPLPTSDSPSPFILANAGRDLALGLAFLVLGIRGNGKGVRVLVGGTVVCIYFLNLHNGLWCALKNVKNVAFVSMGYSGLGSVLISYSL
jgi:hypothetical protein